MCIPNTERSGVSDHLWEQGVERRSTSLLYHKEGTPGCGKACKVLPDIPVGKTLHGLHRSCFIEMARWLSVLDTEKPPWDGISREGGDLKALWSQWANLEVRDGLLCRRFLSEETKNLPDEETVILQVVAPRKLARSHQRLPSLPVW